MADSNKKTSNKLGASFASRMSKGTGKGRAGKRKEVKRYT